jgi:hypothetical protein
MSLKEVLEIRKVKLVLTPKNGKRETRLHAAQYFLKS